MTQTHWNEAHKVCGNDTCWIGLTDDIFEGYWYWIDGTDIMTTYGFNSSGRPTTGQLPWKTGEPSGGNENCVEMWGQGIYNDQECGDLNYPLCYTGTMIYTIINKRSL